MRTLVEVLSACSRRLLAALLKYFSRAGLVLLVLGCVCCKVGVFQRAPCFHCEEYRHSHPHSNPYGQVRGHCTYPCLCPNDPPICDKGVPTVTDGCGCCPICARQKGQSCDKVKICDSRRHLLCTYETTSAINGICKVMVTKCVPRVGKWSQCSSTCGIGTSYRQIIENSNCQTRNESRLCELRPCEPKDQNATDSNSEYFNYHRHYRRHPRCRPTIPSRNPTKLVFNESCASADLYKPTFCGSCSGKRCCLPEESDTKQVTFVCSDRGKETIFESLYMWITKCSCSNSC